MSGSHLDAVLSFETCERLTRRKKAFGERVSIAEIEQTYSYDVPRNVHVNTLLCAPRREWTFQIVYYIRCHKVKANNEIL